MDRHFRVQVQLLGSAPPVWRRLDLPAHLTLLGLHELLCTALGWDPGADYAFELGSRRQAAVNPDNLWQVGERVDATIADLFSRSTQGLHYIHDLEQLHDHLVELEQVLESDDERPRCVDGAGAGPSGAPFAPETCNQAIAAALREEWIEQDALFAEVDDEVEVPVASAYDADRGPDVGLWLALGQGDMVAAVEHYHLRHHLRRRSEALRSHAVLHMAIETQIAEGQPPEARAALLRLREQGLDRHEAVHALGSVLSAHLGRALQHDRFDDEGYAADLRRIDATTWRREQGLGLIPAVMQRGLRSRGARCRRPPGDGA